MSAHKSKEREKKKLARIQQGKILAGVKVGPTKEAIADQLMQGVDAKILEVRALLSQADRILARHRCAGLVAGLKAGAVNSSAK
jgi:hypothetical protein